MIKLLQFHVRWQWMLHRRLVTATQALQCHSHQLLTRFFKEFFGTILQTQTG
jgi:hypothetical protein